MLFLFLLASLWTSVCGMASCENVYVSADYLAWKAHVEELEYAVDGVLTPPSSGSTRDLHWKWHSGFKVGAGYFFGNSGWDLYLNYTRFHTKANGQAIPEEGRSLFATFANPVVLGLPFASSRFDLNYNTLDLEIRDTFCVTPCFWLTPQFGLRGAWVKDKDEIFYDVFPVQNIELRESFKGVGPRVGVNGAWRFCRGFSLFGEGDYALVWGRYVNRFLSESPGLLNADTQQIYYTLRHLTDLRVGLGWDHCFCRSRLAFELAWEHRIWLEYNHYFHFVDTLSTLYVPNSSALSLYGLTLTAKYFF